MNVKSFWLEAFFLFFCIACKGDIADTINAVAKESEISIDAVSEMLTVKVNALFQNAEEQVVSIQDVLREVGMEISTVKLNSKHLLPEIEFTITKIREVTEAEFDRKLESASDIEKLVLSGIKTVLNKEIPGFNATDFIVTIRVGTPDASVKFKTKRVYVPQEESNYKWLIFGLVISTFLLAIYSGYLHHQMRSIQRVQKDA